MYSPGEISKFGDPKLPPWEWGVRQKGMMNKEVMKKNVLDFKHVMDIHQIKIVLIFGTLLGTMRNGDVIANDSDFDVFCFGSDYLKWPAARSELRSKSFYIPEVQPMHDDFIIRDGEKIDINWIIPFGKHYVYNNEIYYPREYFDTLSTTKLFGTDFLVPNNPERILRDLYGDNWKTPSNAKGRINIYPK